MALASGIFVVLARGRGFDAGLSLRIAGTERGLARANPVPVVSLPGGRGSVLRSAQVCLTGSGDAIGSASRADVVVGVGPTWIKAPGLEQSLRPGRPWVPVTSLQDGPEEGVRYRVGSLYMQFE